MIKNQVTQCREERGLCKSQLAHYARVTRSSVTKLEQGTLTPSLDLALRIAKCLKKPVDQIFQLVEPEPISPASLGSVGKPTNNPTETKKGK